MTRTSNYDLIVVEGSDKVNLLTQMNPNTEKIDKVMKKNENSGVQIATELLSGTVHAITRTVPSASMFKFTAVSNYTSGDTFTVDGVQVTALLTSGEALGTGAYIIGSEVLCSLKDTLLTVYTQGGTVKLADDSEKLGGNLPEYYAKQSDLLIVKNTADSASSLSRQNSNNINILKESTIRKTFEVSQTTEIPSNRVKTIIDIDTVNGYTPIFAYATDGNISSAILLSISKVNNRFVVIAHNTYDSALNVNFSTLITVIYTTSVQK